MGLLYNASTAVPQSLQQTDRENTAALNELGIYGRSQDIQTVPFSITDNGDPTYTYVATERLVITGVVFTANCKDMAGIANVNMNVLIAGNEITGPTLTVTNGWDSAQSYVPVPNWILDVGQTIVIDRSGSGEGGQMTVIGYYA